MRPRALAWLVGLAACVGGRDSTPDATGAIDATSCVTTAACTHDSDCAATPGTRCNTALPVPRCQPLECGAAGTGCAGPEFCSPGLVCFDAAHFGESATIYAAGTCMPPTSVRQACNTRCMQAWTFSNGQVLDPCPQQHAQALCLDICGAYPRWTQACETYFTQFNANDFRFEYVVCQSFACPSISLQCGTTYTNLMQSCMP